MVNLNLIKVMASQKLYILDEEGYPTVEELENIGLKLYSSGKVSEECVYSRKSRSNNWDVEIPKQDLQQIVEICQAVFDSKMLQSYDDPDEGTQMVQDLLEITQKAIEMKMGLVSIGD